MSEIGICLMFLVAIGFPFIAFLGAVGITFIGHQFQWWGK